MFVDCLNFTGSWGHNFVGNWFVALLRKPIHCLVNRSCGRTFVCVRETHEIHEHKTPTINDDSTVIFANLL